MHEGVGQKASSILIIKHGAAGDVVRSTSLLHLFPGRTVDWSVDPANAELLPTQVLGRVFERAEEIPQGTVYDLVISLEDDLKVIEAVFERVSARQVYGSYPGPGRSVAYTDDARAWFDMSLISRFGLERANRLKLENRKSFQELLFTGLGFRFTGQSYLLPRLEIASDLHGDIATASKAGARWPLKSWPGFPALKRRLEGRYKVHELPTRDRLLHHVADIAGHRLLVANDSLPMHLAIGLGIPTVAIFTCTSPWEIHEYGVLHRVVSPRLEEYFFSRDDPPEAVDAIPEPVVAEAVEAVLLSFG